MNDNSPAFVSSADSGVYASAFAQSDFGVLRASVTNFVGLGTVIYHWESRATAQFWDDIFVDVPSGQTMARLVFGYNVQQTYVPDPNNWQGLSFSASVIGRPGSGVGFLGTADCGTGPGGVGYGGSYGYLTNLDIPLTATCTLDVPVIPGEQVKLEVNSVLVLYALGTYNESALDSTHTVAVTSTGFVNGAGGFAAAQFTGASGATYPYASGDVPELASLGLVGTFLTALALKFRSRK